MVHHHNQEEWCYHSINNLKGASSITAATNANISIPSSEVDIIRNVINIAGFYVTRNPQVFQQPEEIIRKLTEAWNIISTAAETKESSNNNSVKGASNINNLCPTKKEHFKELLNFMFHL